MPYQIHSCVEQSKHGSFCGVLVIQENSSLLFLSVFLVTSVSGVIGKACRNAACFPAAPDVLLCFIALYVAVL